MKKFKAKLESEDAGSLFFEVPFDVKKELGKARAPVKVTINGYGFRSTVSVYGEKSYVPVRRDRREAAKVKAGDLVAVTLEPDTEARTVELPPELAAALANDARASAEWERQSFTHRREHVEAILEAKKPETRARRVRKILEMLAAAKRK